MPEAAPLIDLNAAKDHLRLEAEETEQDSYIQALIRAALAQIEMDTGTWVQPAEKTDVLDHFPAGAQAIIIKSTPVQGLDAVEYIDPEGTPQSLDAETLRLDQRGEQPKIYPQWGDQWPATISEPESVKITYTVGYTAETLPPTLKMAALLLIGHWFINREAVITGTSSTQIPLAYESLIHNHRPQRLG